MVWCSYALAVLLGGCYLVVYAVQRRHGPGRHRQAPSLLVREDSGWEPGSFTREPADCWGWDVVPVAHPGGPCLNCGEVHPGLRPLEDAGTCGLCGQQLDVFSTGRDAYLDCVGGGQRVSSS